MRWIYCGPDNNVGAARSLLRQAGFKKAWETSSSDRAITYYEGPDGLEAREVFVYPKDEGTGHIEIEVGKMTTCYTVEQLERALRGCGLAVEDDADA